MNIFTRRVAWAYSAILIGAILFMLRRLVLPTVFELEGVPFDIAVGSVANSCFGRPALATCADPTVVLLTIAAVIAITGWGSLGRMAFTAILAVLPLGLYLALGPIWIPLILLLAIPLVMEASVQALFPAS
jgi:hypothetical protein